MNNIRQVFIGTIWITGLSGAGKSTLAGALTCRLREAGNSVVLLDGDQLREVFGANVRNVDNHGRDGRLKLAFQYAHLCKVLAEQGFTVIIATISLFAEIHAWNRRNLPGYVEVFIDVPLGELKRRDPKGIYGQFELGQISCDAGLDLPVDLPAHPDLVFCFDDSRTVEDDVDAILLYLGSR